MHGLVVYVKEGFPFAWDLYVENSMDSYLCFWLYFNDHHKYWSIYSGGTDRPGELCDFLSQMTLLRWLTYLLWSLTVTVTVLLCWIYFYLLMLVFAFPPLGNSGYVISVYINFPSNSKQDTPFHHITYDYSCAD